MTDSEDQASLAAFEAGSDENRPEAEAEAVAGLGTNGGTDQVVDPTEAALPEADGSVELAVTQVDYTIEGSGRDEEPVVHVFGRTHDHELIHVRVLGFRPYFYAPTANLDDEKLDRNRITGYDEGYESIRGEELTKIYGQTPRDVGQMRDEFDHYEADILFPNRLLIDKDIRSGIEVPARYEREADGTRTKNGRAEVVTIHHEEIRPVEVDADPRVCMLDIEVDDRQGFPEDGEEEIICLTTHDSYRDEYVAWLYESPEFDGDVPERLGGYEQIREASDLEVRSFDSEPAMLDALLSHVEETDPDLLSGWNFEDFDAPYLLDRLERLDDWPDHDYDLSLERLSRLDEVWRSDWGGPDVKGRIVFDLLYAYKRTQFTELESYRLDAVGEMELDVGKERYPGDIGDLWEDDPERLLEYNVRDVELCVEINAEQDVIPFWQEVASFVGCKIEDAPTPGDAVDMYVLHEAFGEFVLPSKGQQEAEDFEGGAVFDPISGVKENVTVLDLKSLYPMSMTTINASPETKVDPREYEGETYHTPNDVHFRKEPDGIIREMVDELLAEREEKKALRNDHDPDSEAYERYDRQQGAVKVIMNCFTPDTDVLTPEGVRNIRDLEVGDEVYSLDPDAMEMEVKPVTETHEYPDYRGELVDIQTSKVDFRVTPNHRMLVRENDKNGITEDGWSFVEAGDLYDYCHYEMPHGWSFDHSDALDDTIDLMDLARETTDVQFAVSDGGAKLSAKYGKPNVSRTIDADQFLEFLAWYITEGEVYRADTANYRVKVAQEDPERRVEIASLVDELVDYHYDNGRSIQFSSRIWADLLEELCGGSSEEKRIPQLVFDASEQQKRDFLETLIDGDGDRQEGSWRYSTISDRLKDDVLKLCTQLGLTATVNEDSGVWRVYVTEGGKNSFRMYRNGGTSSAERGVYCVTIQDNNTLLAGRNGKFQYVGNSLYGVFGWDHFRLYDREMSSGVTATNREVIQFTETSVNEEGYEVVYGDSVTGERPVVVRNPDGMVRILPIEDLFEVGSIPTDRATAATPDGGVAEKERRELEGWEALSVSEDRTPEWRSITGAIRHETDKDILKLQHKFGESTTTTDHSYVVDDGEGLVETPPDEVEQPLRVQDLPPVDTVESIDLYDVLSGYTREYEDGRSVGRADAETKVKRVHADEQWVWFGHEHHDDQDKTVKVKRHVDLTADEGKALVRLLAAYVSEGSSSTIETTSSRFGASISEERREWLETFQSDYQTLFDGTTASIVESDSTDQRTVSYETDRDDGETTYEGTTKKLQMMNELAPVFFREFAGQTSRGKRIPSFVFHLPSDLQVLFLDVLVEGDGSREFPRYTDEYAERNFDFETTSRELAAGLSMLLVQLGKKHSLKYRDSKDSYTIRTCDFYRSGRDPALTEVDHDGYVYDISVEENDNFVDGVGGIVLHNTDSVMIELGGDVSKDEAIDQSFALEDRINESYDEFALEELNAAAHRFQIEFEKLYRRFFQAGKKKRYAGHIVWKEGKDVDDVDITGFEYQRSDIAPVTKRVQKEVIDMIVRGEDIAEVEAYVSDVIDEFLEGDADLDEIGIPGGIGKRLDAYDTPTAQVRGAKYANLLLDTNFGRGSKPKRLYLEKVHPDFFERMESEKGLDAREDPLYGEFKRDPDVICFEYADQVPEEFEVDYEKMLDKTLKGPIERILSALDVSWDEVESGQEQTGLGQFM